MSSLADIKNLSVNNSDFPECEMQWDSTRRSNASIFGTKLPARLAEKLYLYGIFPLCGLQKQHGAFK